MNQQTKRGHNKGNKHYNNNQPFVDSNIYFVKSVNKCNVRGKSRLPSADINVNKHIMGIMAINKQADTLNEILKCKYNRKKIKQKQWKC